MTQSIGALKQFAYIVKDTAQMNATLEYWTKHLKAGPFFLMEHAALEGAMYRGQPSDVDLTLALGNSGDVQIEIILQHNNAPSQYNEWHQWQAAGGRSLHHFAYMAGDFEAECKKYRDLGHDVVFECKINGAPLIYFDTREILGGYLEIWDNHPVYKELFTMIDTAHQQWDGVTDPVRVL
ncbi:MAG: VOC family protein [Pseudomonadota bacterium]